MHGVVTPQYQIAASRWNIVAEINNLSIEISLGKKNMMFPCVKKILFFFMLSGKFVNATDKPPNNVTLSYEDLNYFLSTIDYAVLYTENNTSVLRDLELMVGFFLSNGKHTLTDTIIIYARRLLSRIGACLKST